MKNTTSLVLRRSSEICPRGNSVSSSNPKPISASKVPITTTKLSYKQKSSSERAVPFDGGKREFLISTTNSTGFKSSSLPTSTKKSQGTVSFQSVVLKME